MHEELRTLVMSGRILVYPYAFLLPILQGGPPMILSLGLPSIVLLGSGQLAHAFKKNMSCIAKGVFDFIRCLYSPASVHSVQP